MLTEHIGAFVQNTLKPLIEELDSLFSRLERFGMDKEDIKHILAWLIDLEIKKIIWYSITYIVLGAMLCFTLFHIIR